MSSLSARIDALEGKDGEWVIIRKCPACGQMVPEPEASLLGGSSPPCTRGLAHSDRPPPSPRDIVIQWGDRLPDLPE